jgi:inhibitor of KinA sporulation pathway (predicted exonuclease)
MPKRKRPMFDQLLVIDVESTCWNDASSERRHQESEIIEIGYALLDQRTGQITQNDHLVIKPSRSEVSTFCTSLTGWTAEALESGMTYDDACLYLRQKLSSQRRVFASWGNYDRRQFERQSKPPGVKYPFGKSHLNVKDLFVLLSGRQYACNVETALKILNMRFEGRPHSGKDDALNIARILSVLLRDGRRAFSA